MAVLVKVIVTGGGQRGGPLEGPPGELGGGPPAISVLNGGTAPDSIGYPIRFW